MIASVVARLEFGLSLKTDRFETLKSQITAKQEIEIGELVDQCALPMIIDHPDKNEVHNLTRWVQSLSGVEFVDVVLVCLENESSTIKATKPSRDLSLEGARQPDAIT
jgi:hypothetical protein